MTHSAALTQNCSPNSLRTPIDKNMHRAYRAQVTAFKKCAAKLPDDVRDIIEQKLRTSTLEDAARQVEDGDYSAIHPLWNERWVRSNGVCYLVTPEDGLASNVWDVVACMDDSEWKRRDKLHKELHRLS